jgi:chromosome segregation ATPase
LRLLWRLAAKRGMVGQLLAVAFGGVMIEPVMYFGIGFFVAVVIGLGLLPLVHNRAVRLTGQRLEAATPVSLAEIQADKDQLRAEFAMSTRRLEMSVEQLKMRTTSQLAELGKKSDAINRLKQEIGEKSTAVFTMESREKSLRDQIRVTEDELTAKTSALRETERTLSDKLSDLDRRTHELSEQTVLGDSQRVEIVALRTQVEALRAQVEHFEKDIRAAQERLATERSEAEAVSRDLAAERNRAQVLDVRATELEQQLLVHSNEAQELGRKVLDLEARLSEQGKKLAERDYEVIRLRTELETVLRTEADLRAEIGAMEDRHNGMSGRLRSEKTILENELAQIREERTALQQEVSALKHEVETSWATERVENALLRERINDIATEVARLTIVLEGPNSPIEAMLPAEPRRPEENRSAAAGSARMRDDDNPVAPEPRSGSLSDRIRALQVRASRVAPTAPSSV